MHEPDVYVIQTNSANKKKHYNTNEVELAAIKIEAIGKVSFNGVNNYFSKVIPNDEDTPVFAQKRDTT